MTREEAIADIKNNIKPVVGGKSLDMAIEALSQPIVAKHFDIQSGYIYCSPQDAENVEVVVRCKDCKWRKINRKSGTLNCGHEYGMITAKDDNFCNYGEKEDE